MIFTQDWADAQRVWDYHQMGHAPQPCSVAIGLGSHDLGVADTAVDLYKRGLAPLLVFTAATSPTTRERMPRGEAVHYRERALKLGVPSETRPRASRSFVQWRAPLGRRPNGVSGLLLDPGGRCRFQQRLRPQEPV